MIIKRYLVNNMNEAMTRIRYELGKDAVIISQRKIRKPGFSGLFSKKIIEVTAAIENVKKNEEDVVNSIEAIKKALDNKTTENKPEAKSQKESSGNDNNIKDSNSEILKEVNEMKSMLSDIANKTSAKTEKAPKKTKLQVMLESNDITEKIAKKIATKTKNIEGEKTDLEKAEAAIQKMVSISKVHGDGVMVLVGPTGVGKTTTIAKLAGKFSLVDKKKVGLITIDTYRIGAVEQLKTYADIMNIPFRVVLTIKEMEKAITDLSDCDIILVDTTGRSSKNTMQISELRAFIEKTKTDNIHLVMSSTTKNKDIELIIEGYKPLNYNNIIITKLDETTTYGSVLNILEIGKKPLSYVTTGQNVPDDIKRLTDSEVSKLVLGEDSIC